MKQRKIAICIPTCKRPKGLSQLLESLLKLRFQKSKGADLTVIVVDNDNRGSARKVADHFISLFPNFVYDIEPVQNISLARNKTISIAKELGCHFIAFVDDDEFVEPLWLDELLFTHEEYEADIVFGQVIPVFIDPAPAWIIKGRFFERANHKTGEKIRWGQAGNVLIKLECLERIDGPFNKRFGLAGGEDTHLFERLYRTGVRAVWSNEAIVRENIPSSRANFRWILRRAHFNGNTLALAERALDASKKLVFIRILKGLGRILQGAILFLPSVCSGRAPTVSSLTIVARGVGMITGILGFKVEEYRRIHGT